MNKPLTDIEGKVLIEASFADAIAAIESAPEGTLTETQRRYWPTSLRKMADYMDRSVELVPARLVAIKNKVAGLHPNMLEVNAKTFANHRSNVKAALNWYAREHNLPRRGTLMSAEWKVLHDAIEPTTQRRVLSPFFRHLSHLDMEPHEVTDAHVEIFFQARKTGSFNPVTLADRRKLARYWNQMVGKIDGWPETHLTVPPVVRPADEIPEEEFPETLLKSIEDYLDSLRRKRTTMNGKTWRPCRKSSIDTRKREIMSVVRTVVRNGTDLSSIHTLQDLCHPEMVEKIIEHYWTRDGEVPKTYTIDLGWKLRSMAHTIGGSDEAAHERLEEIAHELETYRKSGLTEKNMKLVRLVLQTDKWAQVIALPSKLMAEALKVHNRSPIKAAHLAELAVAIRLLIVAPVRMANLMSTSFDKHLIRPGGPKTSWQLVYPLNETKNYVLLEFPLDRYSSELIDTYAETFRPILMNGRRHDFLFPGETHDHKCPKSMADRIIRTMFKYLGITITPHQFRHAAAAVILKNRPGNYELARRVLGHKNIQSTTNFYVGLETLEANRQYGEMIADFVAGNKKGG
jgi:integrase